MKILAGVVIIALDIKMKDINGKKLADKDQVIVNLKSGQSFQKIVVENDRYFLIGVCKTPLTEELIKNFQITKWKNG